MTEEKELGVAKMELHNCDTCTDSYYSYEPEDEYSHQCPQCKMKGKEPVRVVFNYQKQSVQSDS
jgi:hypothetical protein